MDEKNILALKARLVQLGFEPAVETVLRCNVCFGADAFDVFCSRVVGSDSFHFVVHAERADDQYALKYYSATLRKQVLVPTELAALDQSMGALDWRLLVSGKNEIVPLDSATIDRAHEVLVQLQETVDAADIVKYKYWSGTSLEPMVSQLATLKSEWEISERFHFYDETVLITFDDAVRFLSSRWMEKQMHARKKLLVKKSSGGGSGSGVAEGKLLTKNSRRIQKRRSDINK
ncbi:hypothetical protein GWC95_15315 [Sediminibacterium roseum]|uniref:DUF4304 domain-containing protein n=1 Tax=Sediminibacterium roseum TaxID=1978412 RepID=A0ABW9ZVX2_9BACT|nr:hypothetical protein [Sediminibacterium roseum]NCI51296.1 hypothetical protein [Sediminibacterium roseum]